MTKPKKTKLKRLFFPVGIFLLMFIAESIIGTAGVVSYFYFSGKRNLSKIEKYTINYSKTMAEAFTRVAEFSYSTKKYSSLKTLFHEKIEESTIDEAFFVLNDGKLIVHSSTTIEKELIGNIASDEMSYNLDMILFPVKTKNRDLILNNYNIINKIIPFKRNEKDFLKKYVYKDLNSTGWLFTKAVYFKDKPVGTVNFIVSKDRVYASINESINQAKHYSILVVMASMIISFFVSLIILFRYRSIQKNALKSLTDQNLILLTETPPNIPLTIADITHDQEDSHTIFPDSNTIDHDMDFIIEDDFDNDIVEEDETGNSVTISRNSGIVIHNKIPGEVLPIKIHETPPDEDEYITVELLGEIEPENELASYIEEPERIKEYIAPVINLEDYKKSIIDREIRDAIPIRKQR